MCPISELSKRCWEFDGARLKAGYGKAAVIGAKPKRTDLVHRQVYREVYGEIPAGCVVRHTCDNPPCYNPRHLIAGTQLDNVNDMLRRGRHVPGRGRTHLERRDDKGRFT